VGSRPPDEETLVARAKRGETTAYEELVRMHQGIAFRVALVAAGDRGDAEEAAQDAFVKAYRALGRFREGSPFRPWLLRIVANEARNRVRSTRRQERLVLRAAAVDPGGAAPSPETAALDRDEAMALTRALEKLREPDRLVIAYRYLFELSEAEMADALGVRPGTVKSRLSRALGRLRAELETSGEVTR
jgi:RNA polymerase sigma-70 factor, ECF subfamily